MPVAEADEPTYPRAFFKEPPVSRAEAFGIFAGRMAAVTGILVYELARSTRDAAKAAMARRRAHRF